MAAALKQFQSRHGLAATGVLDRPTVSQLNVPIAHRIEQLDMTLERWRWIPRHFSEAPVVVNIPEFRVRAYDEDGHVSLSMPVIVGGTAHRKSPVLQASMTQVVFHPYWNMLRDIQEHELVPHLLKSSSNFDANGYEVVDHRGAVVRNPASTLDGLRSGALRVRQIPGAHNALGAIKFVFPNAFDVYMHGTPQTQLLQRSQRDLSHGCIRVEDPVALAVWVLRKQGGWSKERIEASVADPATQTISLDRSIPVLIVYGTGIAAEDGSTRSFNDIYGYDGNLQRSLDSLSAARLRLAH